MFCVFVEYDIMGVEVQVYQVMLILYGINEVVGSEGSYINFEYVGVIINSNFQYN